MSSSFKVVLKEKDEAGNAKVIIINIFAEDAESKVYEYLRNAKMEYETLEEIPERECDIYISEHTFRASYDDGNEYRSEVYAKDRQEAYSFWLDNDGRDGGPMICTIIDGV